MLCVLVSGSLVGSLEAAEPEPLELESRRELSETLALEVPLVPLALDPAELPPEFAAASLVDVLELELEVVTATTAAAAPSTTRRPIARKIFLRRGALGLSSSWYERSGGERSGEEEERSV